MDREELHDVVLGRLGARRELVEALGVVEPCDEARERAGVVGGEEAGDLVDERTQLRRRDAGGAARLVRGELDVQPQFRLDEPDELGDRCAGCPAEPREHRARLAQAFPRGGREAGEPRVPVGLSRDEVQRVDERRTVGPRDAAEPFGDLRAERAQGRVVRRETAGEEREGAQVGEPDRPARPREQPQQRRPRVGVAEHSEDGDDVHDLGGGQQAAEPQDAMRDAAGRQGVAEAHHVLLAAEQHRPGRRPPVGGARRAHPREPRRDAVGLVLEARLEHGPDLSGGCARAGAQTVDAHRRAGAEGREHRVRRIEHPGAVAPARQEGEARAPAIRRERRREAGEVARARPAPRVDRLVRVADGHDAGAGEQGREQVGLHDGGVLVLVEEHDAIAVSDLRPHGGVIPHDAESAGDLIGEVDDPASLLLPRIVASQVGQQRQRRHAPLGVDDVLVHDRALAGGGEVEDAGEPRREGGEGVEVDQVVDGVAGDAQGCVDDRARGLGPSLEPRIVGGEHDPAHEQPRRRLRQHRRLAVLSDAHAVLAHDAVGEAVVRRHGRAVQQLVRVDGRRSGPVARREHVEDPGALGVGAGALPQPGEHVELAGRVQLRQERQQPAALELGQTVEAPRDALGELTRCLARERQPEHLVTAHESVGDEPHHAAGHRLGLAASRAGDDERGRERRLDHRGLLGRRGELAEGGRDRRGRDGTGHDALTAAIVWMRQSPYEWSSRQCSLYAASKDVPRMTVTAASTRARNAARRSSSKGCCVGVA